MKILPHFALGIGSAAALLAGCAGSKALNTVPAAVEPQALAHHHRFQYTGREQKFKVPATARQIVIDALGAVGAGGLHGHGGGRGGRTFAVIPVRPGETLYVFVGGAGSFDTGSQSFNGGSAGGAYLDCTGSYCFGNGGGGASDVREAGDSLDRRIVVAGGGGGEGSCKTAGGGGGGKRGDNGSAGIFCFRYSRDGGGAGGKGGTSKHGGKGGAGETGGYGNGSSGSNGASGVGGNGGYAGYNRSCRSSCYGGGAGGGGGGGFYGGGGGGGGNAGATDYQYVGGPGGGGGGGSGYVEPLATGVRMWQHWNTATSNGLVIFSWRDQS